LHFVEPLKLDVPLITASGALIKDPIDHRTLFRAEFGAGVLEGALRMIGAGGYDAVLYADTFAEGFDFYAPRLKATQFELAEYFERNIQVIREWPTLMTSPPPGIFAGFACAQKPPMLELAREMMRQYPGDLQVHVIRSPRYTGWMCEFAPGGISKWSAVQHLARDWGIADEEICAVGDDVNDIPMVRGAGLGVAMGNAVAELKAAADRVAPCHDSDGLVEVVRWILE
jgi:hydroxymethylpyrimidine pyrophosphatase-like HAD family hydrolase